MSQDYNVTTSLFFAKDSHKFFHTRIALLKPGAYNYQNKKSSCGIYWYKTDLTGVQRISDILDKPTDLRIQKTEYIYEIWLAMGSKAYV